MLPFDGVDTAGQVLFTKIYIIHWSKNWKKYLKMNLK